MHYKEAFFFHFFFFFFFKLRGGANPYKVPERIESPRREKLKKKYSCTHKRKKPHKVLERTEPLRRIVGYTQNVCEKALKRSALVRKEPYRLLKRTKP